MLKLFVTFGLIELSQLRQTCVFLLFGFDLTITGGLLGAIIGTVRSVPQEGQAHAYPGRSTGTQADKPMPGLRCRNRSGRDRAAPSARQFRDSRLPLRTMRTDQIVGRARRAFAPEALTQSASS